MIGYPAAALSGDVELETVVALREAERRIEAVSVTEALIAHELNHSTSTVASTLDRVTTARNAFT
jgi:hypothetical protein